MKQQDVGMSNRVNKPLKDGIRKGFLENKGIFHFSSASESLTDSPGAAVGRVLPDVFEGSIDYFPELCRGLVH